MMIKHAQNQIDCIFLQYYARLKNYACRFVNIRDAEDVVQDSFLYLWDHREEISFIEDTSPLLFKMVHNRCLNILRHNDLVQSHVDRVEAELLEMEMRSLSSSESETESKLFREELNGEVKRQIDRLPERCRQVFLLSYHHQLKSQEIADLLNLSKSTVDNHLYNALVFLRERLKK